MASTDCICNYCFHAFCLAASQGNFKSFSLWGRNVKSEVLPALCTLCAFLCQSLMDITSSAICPVSCTEGGTLSLPLWLLQIQWKRNILFLWSLKFLNINELERSKQIISTHSGTTALWIRSMSLELHCPRSWLWPQKCQRCLWLPSCTTAWAISWYSTGCRSLPLTVASLTYLQA